MRTVDDARAGSWLVRAWLAALSLVVACAGDALTPLGLTVGHDVPDAAHDGQPRTPTEPGPQCLQPPWTPGASSDLSLRACDSDRSVSFVLGSGEAATDAEVSGFLDSHREQIHALEGVVGSGWGLCCRGDWSMSQTCIALTVRVCTTPVSGVAQEIERLRTDDPKLAQKSLNISIELQGLIAPRCDTDECGPEPYDSDSPLPTGPTRTAVRPSSVEQPSCSDDGECVKDGCGNECDHWTIAGGPGTCQYETELQGAACGCVESRCSWFK